MTPRLSGLFSFAFAAVFLSACGAPKGTTCRSDTECAEGFRCDLETGACRAVAAQTCAAACPELQQCVETSCVDRYTGLRFLAPEDGGVVGASTPIRAELSVAPGRARVDPSSLSARATLVGSAEVETVPLSLGAPGEYAGHWSPPVGGIYELSLSLPDAGLVAPSRFVRVDRTGPSLVLDAGAPVRAAPPPGVTRDQSTGFSAAFLRGESVTLEVSSDDADLDPTSVSLVVIGVSQDGGAGRREPSVSVPARVTPCAHAYCGTVELSTSSPELAGLRGHFQLSVSAFDVRGNEGSALSRVPVTRLAWQLDGGGPFATPLVTGNGELVASVGSSAIVRVAASGEVRARQTLGSLAQLAVDPSDSSRLVVTRIENDAGLLELRRLGEPTALAVCRSELAGGALAPVFLDATTAATATWDGGRGALLALSTGGGCRTLFLDGGFEGGGLAVDAQRERLVVTRGEGGQGAILHELSDAGVSGPRAVSLSSRAFEPAASRDGFVLSGGLTEGTVHALAPDGGIAWVHYLPFTGTFVRAGPAAIDADGFVFFGATDGTLRKVRLGDDAGITVQTSGVVRGTPLLGRDGLVYALSDDGALQVLRKSDLSLEWRAALSARASPTIDCARGEDGGSVAGPARLLFATGDGLVSVVVDSPGLDTDAPWPQRAHDPLGTGSTGTSLSRFLCP